MPRREWSGDRKPYTNEDDMEWVIGCGGVALLVVLAGVAVYFVMNRQVQARMARIKEEGELLLCWIVTAPDDLYEVNDVPGYGEARVVFSTTDEPDLKKRLKEAAKRLKKGELVDEDISVAKVEKFYDKYKEQRWLHGPLRVPKWLVGDFEVYTAVVQVYWRQLPENKLTLPYLYCYVLFGEEGGVEMDEYPDEE
jgi:hypothetical protein